MAQAEYEKVQQQQPLTVDPVYYGTIAVFALLTTLLPVALGQPRFLPIAQAIPLTIFMAIPLRAGLWRRSIIVMAVWLPLQLLAMALFTRLFPNHVDSSIPNGFEYHAEILTWVYGADTAAPGVQQILQANVIDALGVILGSLLTAGLFGCWFLMRIVNETGFSMGVIAGAVGSPFGPFLAILPWEVSWIAGLAGFVISFSEPLLRRQWSPKFYWAHRRSLLIGAAILSVTGIALALALPSIWQAIIATQVE